MKKPLFFSIVLNLFLFALLSFVVYKTHLISVLLNRNTKVTYNPQYEQRLTLFEQVETEQTDVIFLGDSLTERGLWNELFPNVQTVNRGIGSDTSAGILNRIDNVLKLKPKKIFLMVGVNDLSLKVPQEKTLENLTDIIQKTQKSLPDTEIYLQSVLPVRNDYTPISNEAISNLNAEIMKLAEECKVTYIEINKKLTGSDKSLKPEYTEDGIHLKGEAYMIWVSELEKYIQ